MKRKTGVLLVMLFVLVILTGCKTSASIFENEVKTGNYEKAIEIYTNDIAGNSEAENTVLSFLSGYLDSSISDYGNGTISENIFINNYTTLEKINDQLFLLNNLDNIYTKYLDIKQSKQNFSLGIQYADNGNFEEAIIALSAVSLEDIENYDSAQEKLSEVIDSYQKMIISNAKQLADSSKYEEAVICLNEAESIVGCTTELESCLTDIYTQKYRTAIDVAYNSGKYATVIKEYVQAKDNTYVTISSDMTNKYSSSVSIFLDNLNKNAEEAFGSNKDYSAAIKVLNNAISEVDVDEKLVSEIEQKINQYKEYVPISLTSMEYTKKGTYICVGDASTGDDKDVNGKVYNAKTIICPSGGLLSTEVSSSDDDAYVLYNLNFKYSTISGTIYRPYRSLSCDYEWEGTSVKIYGDDALLYEAPNFTTKTYESIEFNLNIKGVRNLKIVMRGVWGEDTGWIGLYSRHPRVCMAEVTLQK